MCLGVIANKKFFIYFFWQIIHRTCKLFLNNILNRRVLWTCLKTEFCGKLYNNDKKRCHFKRFSSCKQLQPFEVDQFLSNFWNVLNILNLYIWYIYFDFQQGKAAVYPSKGLYDIYIRLKSTHCCCNNVLENFRRLWNNHWNDKKSLVDGNYFRLCPGY